MWRWRFWAGAGTGIGDQPRSGSPCTEADGAEAEKKSLHATERDSEENRRRREEFVARLATIPPERLVFLDESGVTTRMPRSYARAVGGARVHESRPEGVTPSKSRAFDIGLVTPQGKPNPIRRDFSRLKVINNKHIPLKYLTSNRSDRLELLAGLIDTDGSLGNGVIDFLQKSEKLVDHVAFLARSLGFAVTKKSCMKRATNGSSGFQEYFRLTISGEISLIPCRLKRKQAAKRLQKKSVLRVGFSIEELPEDYFYGFELSGDGLYLLQDFTVTHNSGKTDMLMRFVWQLGVNSLIVVPSKPLMTQLENQLIEHFGRRNVIRLTANMSAQKLRKMRKRPIRLINIGALASAQKKGVIGPLVEDVDALFIDEIHHAGSRSYTNLLEVLDHVYYRFGFTGTFLRNDSKTLDMWGFLSNVIYHYPAHRAIADGYLTPMKVYIHELEGKPKRMYQSEYRAHYCGDKKKRPEKLLKRIKKIFDEYVEKGQQVLILVNRKDQCGQIIHDYLDELGLENTYVSGDSEQDEIDDAIRDFNEKQINICIGSQVIGEGIDIRSADHLIMAQGGKSEIAIVQAAGRLVRLFDGKRFGHLHDFRFKDTKYMEKHQQMRKDILERNFAPKFIVVD